MNNSSQPEAARPEGASAAEAAASRTASIDRFQPKLALTNRPARTALKISKLKQGDDVQVFSGPFDTKEDAQYALDLRWGPREDQTQSTCVRVHGGTWESHADRGPQGRAGRMPVSHARWHTTGPVRNTWQNLPRMAKRSYLRVSWPFFGLNPAKSCTVP